MTLAGKVAFVTGGSRGIGRASCLALADEGARVAVGYRQDKDGAIECASACGGFPIRIDVTEPEAVASAYDEIRQEAGAVSILVNNAGITRDKLLIRMTEEDWNAVIDSDLTGVYRCTKQALPGMLEGGWGRIISVGSVVGLAGNKGQSNYAAAKAGLIGFTKALAREIAGRGITVNVVAPGFVETQLTSGLSGPARQGLLQRIPLGRPAEASEIAEAIRFCARASYVTGQVINVDGGLL